jgi:hypothetical protein
MAVPCENGDVLKEHSSKINSLVVGQERIEAGNKEMLAELRSVLRDIRDMFESSIEHRKDIERLRSDVENLGRKQRETKFEIDASLGVLRADVNTLGLWKAGINEKIDWRKIDNVHDFVLQEKGWRKFVPTFLSIVAVILAIITGVVQLNKAVSHNPIEHSIEYDKR